MRTAESGTKISVTFNARLSAIRLSPASQAIRWVSAIGLSMLFKQLSLCADIPTTYIEALFALNVIIMAVRFNGLLRKLILGLMES